MTDEELALAHAVERLLREPMIVEAFDMLAVAYTKAWQSSAPNEPDKRELAYAHYKAVLDVKAELQRRVNNLQGHRAQVKQREAMEQGRAYVLRDRKSDN